MMRKDLSIKKAQTGIKIIIEASKKIGNFSGVYRMIGKNNEVLYIGKAKSLNKRIRSYTDYNRLSHRLKLMVKLTSRVDTTITETESEAMLLESNLIKKLQPRFNILLRDDKSFPHIFLSEEDFPRIRKHRGAQKQKGSYYGPFASSNAVNKTITTLERAFLLRSCTDSVFYNRKRPCLLYQIKRCSAPCVGKISETGYAQMVKQAKMFLDGKNEKIKDELAVKMEQASDKMEYEKAIIYRNRIRALASISQSQDINIENLKDADIIALSSRENDYANRAIEVTFFRSGKNYGQANFFPKQTSEATDEEIIHAFLSQFYSRRLPPKRLIVSVLPELQEFIERSLSQRSHRKITITRPKRGRLLKLIEQAQINASQALLNQKINLSQIYKEIQSIFTVKKTIRRIEVYDNSHIGGSNSFGVMIVSTNQGLEKREYRKFSIKHENKGNDYAMLEEVLKRRFKKSVAAPLILPEIIFIDGGIGHALIAHKILTLYDLQNEIKIIAIAKPMDRKSGQEKFYSIDGKNLSPPNHSPLRNFLISIRNEAHRFAITAHRKKRDKSSHFSRLDNIEGIGRIRKKALLRHFGSVNNIVNSKLKDIIEVEGINQSLAKRIQDYLKTYDK